MKELEQFLLDRAMEHDSPTLLFSLAAEFLMSAKTIRPGVSILEKMIASARTGATVLTPDLVGHLLTAQRCSDLDRLDLSVLPAERIGMSVLRDAAAGVWKPLRRDHGRLSAMDSSYSYLRQFTPGAQAAVDFTGGSGRADLMAAVAILKSLNASGGRKIPADAPASFVPARYADYLEKAAKPATTPASGITGSCA